MSDKALKGYVCDVECVREKVNAFNTESGDRLLTMACLHRIGDLLSDISMTARRTYSLVESMKNGKEKQDSAVKSSNIVREIETYINTKAKQGVDRKECVDIMRLAYLASIAESLKH